MKKIIFIHYALCIMYDQTFASNIENEDSIKCQKSLTQSKTIEDKYPSPKKASFMINEEINKIKYKNERGYIAWKKKSSEQSLAPSVTYIGDSPALSSSYRISEANKKKEEALASRIRYLIKREKRKKEKKEQEKKIISMRKDINQGLFNYIEEESDHGEEESDHGTKKLQEYFQNREKISSM